MENNMNKSLPGAGVCCHDWLSLIGRLVIGGFFLANGLHKIFGLFDGPGLDAYLNIMVNADFPLWASYAIVFGELIGGALLVLGAGAELGALLVMPWWVVCVFFKVRAEDMLSVDVLRLLPESYAWVNTALLVVIPLLALVLIYRGPGKCSPWDPCKNLRCSMFNCGCFFGKKGCNGNR